MRSQVIAVCVLALMVFGVSLVDGDQGVMRTDDEMNNGDRSVIRTGNEFNEEAFLEAENSFLFVELLTPLDPEVLHQAVFEVFRGKLNLTKQVCSFRVNPDSDFPVIEIAPGNSELLAMLKNASLGSDFDLQVRVSIDGERPIVFTAAELVQRSEQLLREPIQPQDLLEIAYSPGGEKMSPALESEMLKLQTKATFDCPNAHPACDDIFDECMEEMCNGDYQCEKQCKNGYYNCLHGSVTKRWTNTSTTLNSLFAIDECVYKTFWEMFSPKYADGWNVRFKNENWERRYCPTGGTFDRLLDVTYTYDQCWAKQNQGCGMFNGFHVSCYLN